ncbi:hypothetical protein E1267_20385 [Nonomuraea longispora]|uniref:Uncharacterized protein n=1 Tax=Nonomuraea longispora TaxID=1848320 RepID=A0A4R4N8E6_9ACTN|nr:hypothetical protein [Nonomuraea longispora]TDC05198.1 hypothetical protein E1267_20385 [Nonomuraea longispora]
MARTRATAVSAIVLALGLAGAGAAPFIVQSASASAAAYDPVEGCNPGEVCDAYPENPETTVTVTATAGEPPPDEPEEEQDPETTITQTVTATPTKTKKSPTPKKTTKTATPSATPSSPQQPPPQPLPTQSVEVPPSTSATATPEESVEMPAVAPSDTPTDPLPSETLPASSEEVPLELRNAAPEFDQRTLTQKLSIPALVLVLLALFAVLIFEGRLRRMAHAAAVRKAGPVGHPEMPPGGGYPAGPGYATAGFPAPGYPGGTAYAPIISFVPVQTYPGGQVQYGAVYQEPQPVPPQGYPQQEQHQAEEPVVLRPDEFGSYTHEAPKQSEYRDPFEPVIPPADIPPGGASPYEDDREHPIPPASAAEAGDAEPWQGQPASLFEPPARGDADYDPPPYLPADGEVTAIQPLPEQPAGAQEGQEPAQETPGDAKRKRRWGRKK